MTDPDLELPADVAALVADVVDEFQARQDAGKNPEPEEYAARHPEIAAKLRRILAVMRLAAPPLKQAEPPGILGDFQLGREIGRGGMGVVFEAEQISLGRRVALKVLPFAALADSKMLQRFKNEARAAAALDHPHIVKVHAVGQDRGVHFIAMQFIDGRPLSELIRDRRGETAPRPSVHPGASTVTNAVAHALADTAPIARGSTSRSRGDAAYFRQVAEWGIQAAEALEHAHSMGVVHRDVKPGNLLLDKNGQIWVADFGLAKLAASDGGVTASGDILGTLRYMSPEQAGAKHGLVDARTDVYALGATLYELLTGVPAVDGDDKAEILRKIAFEEPVALRKLNRSIPADLETVVLKCLATEPGERYATAGELADDLRRFLAGKATLARPITVRQRLGRWVRRHPRRAAAGIFLVLVLVSGAWAVDRTRLTAEVAARGAADDADGLKARGRYSEALAEARRAAASLPTWGSRHLRRRVAELEADLILLNELESAHIARVSGHRVGSETGSSAMASQYTSAFSRYGVDLVGDDEETVVLVLRGRSVVREASAALDDWGMWEQDPALSARLFRIAEAIDENPTGLMARARTALKQRDLPGLRRLAEEAEGPVGSPIEQVYLSDVLWYLDRIDEAANLLMAGLRHHRDNFLLNNLAGEMLCRSGQKAKAIPYFMVAAALRPDLPAPALNLAGALGETDRPNEAELILRDIIRVHPDFALAQVSFGKVLSQSGKPDEAEAAYRRAIEIGPDLVVAHENLAAFLSNHGRHAEALPFAQRARELEPHSPLTTTNLGVILTRLDRASEAEPFLERAVALGPTEPNVHANLGSALARQKKFVEAETEYRTELGLNPRHANALAGLAQVLAQQGRFADAEPYFRQTAESRSTDPTAWIELGNNRKAQARLDEAEAAYRKAADVGPKNAEAQYALGMFLKDPRSRPAEAEPFLRRATALRPTYAPAFYNLGDTIQELDRPAEAEAVYRQCLALSPEFAEAHCNLGGALQAQGKLSEALAELRRGHELGTRRNGWKFPSAQWVAEAERLVALEAELPEVVAGRRKPVAPREYVNYANVALMTGRVAAAAKLFSSAFAAEPAVADMPGVRYNAACAALRAAAAPTPERPLTEADRARLRAQAQNWLVAELARLQQAAARPKAGPMVANTIRHWNQDPDLSSIRDPDPLAALPAAERKSWQRFWAETARLVGPGEPPREPGPRPREILSKS